MVFEGKWDGNFKKDRESNGESNMWCKTDGEKDNRGPNEDVGIEGNSGSDSKGKWSEMVRACVEELGMMDMLWEKRWSLKWKGKRKWGWPKKTWKTQVEKESSGLKTEGAMSQAKWRVGVGEIAVRMG